MSRSSSAAGAGRPVIMCFRDDLRLADNRALMAAIATGQPLIAIYVFDEETSDIRPLGGASRWWLHHSLSALTADLTKLGAALHIYRGEAGQLVPKLAIAAKASAVFWSRRYGGVERDIDTSVKTALRDVGIEAESCNDHLLIEPWEVKTKSGEPFKVFTPFWRAARMLGDAPEPLGRPRKLQTGEPPASPKPVTLGSTACAYCPPSPTGPPDCATPGHQARLARARRSCISRRGA